MATTNRWICIIYDTQDNKYAVYWYEENVCVAEEGFIDPNVYGPPLHQKDIDFITGCI